MSGQFYACSDLVRIFKINGVDRERAVRFYCEMSDAAWALQLRAPMSLGGNHGPEGKDFVIAHATLDRAELVALRDAIDEALAGEDLP